MSNNSDAYLDDNQLQKAADLVGVHVDPNCHDRDLNETMTRGEFLQEFLQDQSKQRLLAMLYGGIHNAVNPSFSRARRRRGLLAKDPHAVLEVIADGAATPERKQEFAVLVESLRDFIFRVYDETAPDHPG